jgi:hypothetical protein
MSNSHNFLSLLYNIITAKFTDLVQYFFNLENMPDFNKSHKDASLWIARIDDIVCENSYEGLLDCLTVNERNNVERFHFNDDRKRGLLSILLQRALIRSEFHVSDDNYEIHRTKEVNFKPKK